MDKTELGIGDEQYFNAELDDQAEYNVNIAINLDEYEGYFVQKREESVGITAKDVRADVDGSSDNRVVAGPQDGSRDSSKGSVQPGPTNISVRSKRKATRY